MKLLRPGLVVVTLVLGVTVIGGIAVSSNSDRAAASNTPPAHANWFRHPTIEDLVLSSTTVVRGTIEAADDIAAIDAASANALADAPAIPRRLIRVRTEAAITADSLRASQDNYVTLVEHLAPKGTHFPENPPLRVGHHIVVFARPAKSIVPGDEFERDGILTPVGIDGVYTSVGGGPPKAALDPAYTSRVANFVNRPFEVQRALGEAREARNGRPPEPNPDLQASSKEFQIR